MWDYERAFLTPSSHQAADTNDDKWCEEYFVKQTDALDLVYLTQISGVTGKTHASAHTNPNTIPSKPGNGIIAKYYLKYDWFDKSKDFEKDNGEKRWRCTPRLLFSWILLAYAPCSISHSPGDPIPIHPKLLR